MSDSPYSHLPDADLVYLCRFGVPDAFTPLVNRHWSSVCRLTYRKTQNRADAEDLAQKVFLRAWRSLHGFDVTRPFEAWLIGITFGVSNSAYAASKTDPMKHRILGEMPDVGSRKEIDERQYDWDLEDMRHDIAARKREWLKNHLSGIRRLRLRRGLLMRLGGADDERISKRCGYHTTEVVRIALYHGLERGLRPAPALAAARVIVDDIKAECHRRYRLRPSTVLFFYTIDLDKLKQG